FRKLNYGEKILKIRFLFISFLLITSFIANTSLAKDYKNQKLWWRNKQVVEELQLTPDQVNRIDKIFKSNKGEIKAFHKELKSKENQLKNLIQNPDSTRSEVLELTDEINDIKAEGQKLKIQMLWEIREVLNPEQRIKLKELKQDYMKKRPKNTSLFFEDCFYLNHIYH
ncbi:MAG: Spy/CpxP family protein refolding chaperone, partial [Thermodesulfobacteriota bacterium]